MSQISDWVETSRRLEATLWKMKKTGDWAKPGPRELLKSSPELKHLLERSQPVCVLIQNVVQGSHPDLICLLELRPNGEKNEFGWVSEPYVWLQHDPHVIAFDLDGKQVYEGVLAPSDDALLQKLYINHFLVVTNKAPEMENFQEKKI